MTEGVGRFLRHAAERWPERPALVERRAGGRRTVTYGELDLAARRGAARLLGLGIAPGDRVAVLGANGEDLVAAWFAVAYAGAAVLPISTVSAPPEVAHRLAHAACRAIVFDAECAALASAATASLRSAARAGAHVETTARRASSPGRSARAGTAASALPMAELLAASGAPLERPVAVDPASPAMVLYTSGTTGEARGALIAHASLVAHTSALVEQVLSLHSEDRVLGVLPLAHSFGCRMAMLASLHAGATCVLVARFDARASLQAMIEERITWLAAVPTMYAAWGTLSEGPRPAHLRWCLAAGSPLAEETLRRAEARLGAEIRQAYGMTEATISTLNAPPDQRIVGSVGRPAPGVEVAVVDHDGRALPPGACGEVLLRGPNLMSGYLGDPAATADALRDGWMHSGDLGRLDEQGRLFVVDRLKDMIIRGGNNVYPSEVEAALASHPAVLDVAVIGRPDPYLGEEIVAVVVARPSQPPSPAELRDWAAARIAATKVPREYALVDTLPLGASRKVQKRALRERLAAGGLATQRVARERAES